MRKVEGRQPSLHARRVSYRPLGAKPQTKTSTPTQRRQVVAALLPLFTAAKNLRFQFQSISDEESLESSLRLKAMTKVVANLTIRRKYSLLIRYSTSPIKDTTWPKTGRV